MLPRLIYTNTDMPTHTHTHTHTDAYIYVTPKRINTHRHTCTNMCRYYCTEICAPRNRRAYIVRCLHYCILQNTGNT